MGKRLEVFKRYFRGSRGHRRVDGNKSVYAMAVPRQGGLFRAADHARRQRRKCRDGAAQRRIPIEMGEKPKRLRGLSGLRHRRRDPQDMRNGMPRVRLSQADDEGRASGRIAIIACRLRKNKVY